MRSLKLSAILATLLGFLAVSSVAYADLDPELAEVGTKNDGGFYVGTGVKFGQSYATGGSNPGLAYLLSIEPGYVAARDSWGRVEASLELSTGKYNFTRKDDLKTKVDMPIGFMALAKIGYGMSLGHDTFGVIRLGAGPVGAKYKATYDGIDETTSETITGIAGQLRYDLIVGLSGLLDVVGGFEITHVAMETDDNEPLNLNVPMFDLGVRFKF